MASAKLFNIAGNELGSVDLSDAVFDVEPNQAVVHSAVVALQSAKRQGNAETKTRGEVRGGGKKPFRQKGTGRARRGSSREPIMRGGGTVFGPHKRSYRQSVSTKVRRKALQCALSDHARHDKICVLDSVPEGNPKTKPFVDFFSHIVRKTGAMATDRKTLPPMLLITAENQKEVLLSIRNIPRVTIRTADDLNALDVLKAKHVVMVQDALAKLEERLS